MNIDIFNQVFARHNEIAPSRQSIWFLHGFGDSGLAYREAFDAPIAHAYNLYVLDLPGFGVSPLNPDCRSIKQQAELLSQIIAEVGSGQKVNIVAHSLGALLGTWICQSLQDNIHYFFSIEGNLTEADSYFSSKPLQFESAIQFADSFKGEIFEIARTEERYKRYYSSIQYADPLGMWNWGYSSQEHIRENTCGFEFKDLPCKKIYIWGDVDTPDETQEFIRTHDLPNRKYPGVGHWHMIENAISLYADMLEILRST